MIIGKTPKGDTAAEIERIRQLFLQPKPVYSIDEAAALLAMELPEVQGWMASGELEGVHTADGIAVSWDELVSFGIDFWSQEAVEDALGSDVADLIPELVRLTHLEVRIPRMQVLTLERLAALDGQTVSAVLARELWDLVSVHAPWLSMEMPGFAESFAWPGGE
jgi:hypothetical protein